SSSTASSSRWKPYWPLVSRCSSSLASASASSRCSSGRGRPLSGDVACGMWAPLGQAAAYRVMGGRQRAGGQGAKARGGLFRRRPDQQLQLVRHAVPLGRVGQGGLLAVDHRPLRREFGVDREEMLL